MPSASSLMIVEFTSRSANMIRRTSKYATMAVMMAFAAAGHAGSATVSPPLAASSKAQVETLAK
jgi:hypothetical protein